LASGKA